MSSLQPEEKTVRPLRILRIAPTDGDVETLTRELLRAQFAPSWLRVETQTALDAALERETWDLVLTDWTLPALDAVGVFAALAVRERKVAFVAIASERDAESLLEAMRAGIHYVVPRESLFLLGAVIEQAQLAVQRSIERRRIEEQLVVADRMVSVGTLAAGVAHEINNPLATVLANLELATRETADLLRAQGELPRLLELRDELRDAREAAERVRATVRDLKTFSRSDDESLGPIDLQRVLDSSARMAWNEVRHRARLVKDYQPAPAVEGNEARLGQVFLNLIVNAAQAIPEGKADEHQISLVIRSTTAEVIVEVHDSGAGIPPEVLTLIFAPFFTTKPVGVGTGLGLSISQRIINKLGGRITVESEVGKGTVFRVHLRRAQTVAPSPPDELVSSAPPPPRRGKLLVIEDEPSLLLAIERTLSGHHDVTTLSRAYGALERIVAGARYDVILCDLMMPEMTGMDLHAALLSAAPDQALRMIFLSGGTFTPRARAFLDQVPNLRIEKPFELMELRTIVGERVR